MSDATRERLHIYKVVAMYGSSIRPADANELLSTCLQSQGHLSGTALSAT